MKKRLLSILLAVAMLLAILPALSHQAYADVIRYWPVPGHTSLYRGYSSDHTAIDVNDANINGATVIASVGGTVCTIHTCGIQHYGDMHTCSGFGTGIVIAGDDGYYYQYAHMQAGSIPGDVYYGAYVPAGKQVGRVGTTGNSSGPHLHFQMSSSSSWWTNPVNPQNFTFTYTSVVTSYENIGDEFDAYIKFPATGHGVCNVNNNVQLGTYGSQSNLWHFIRQSNGSYMIVSAVNNTVMDVYNNDSANETNLQTYANNGTIAQRFYIQSAGNGKYYILAANCGKAMDVKYGANSTDGTNIHIYTPNGSADQTFEINKKSTTQGKNGWIQESGKWCFYQNGQKVKNQWKKDSKGWCYLGSDGYQVKKRWVQDSIGWCYIGSDGYMVTNRWVTDSAGWCYVGSNGYMVTNRWVADSSGWCYLDASGHMARNAWIADSIGWCYVGGNGYMVTNSWAKDSKGWCWIGGSGYIVKNQWVQSGGQWYYIDSNGYMVTGVHLLNKRANQFTSGGVWQGEVSYTGWIYQNNSWYYAKSGNMHTGWLQQGNKWYAFNPDGTMIIGWATEGNDEYYFSNDGAMYTGWLKYGDAWYYFGSSGKMHTGWLQQGSKWYAFNSDGTMITGWASAGNDVYYFGSDGVMCTGWNQIDGQWYNFGSNGVKQ